MANLITTLDPMNATVHVVNPLHSYCAPSLFVPTTTTTIATTQTFRFAFEMPEMAFTICIAFQSCQKLSEMMRTKNGTKKKQHISLWNCKYKYT